MIIHICIISICIITYAYYICISMYTARKWRRNAVFCLSATVVREPLGDFSRRGLTEFEITRIWLI